MPRLIVSDVMVECRRRDGSIVGAQAKEANFATPSTNDFIAVNLPRSLWARRLGRSGGI